ncbi:MAG TPA: 5'-nucleotidase C-terminal domain-containing protein [Accumulibacter sp.]|nr:5'-nucleotidase C-terminal domain-containing protein [Accumulibacter sp.]
MKTMHATLYRPSSLLLACLTLTLGACQSAPPPASDNGLEINIAHINDHHSHLDAQTDFELIIDGRPTRVEAAGFPRLTSLFKTHATRPNLLKLHAGDAMTGTLYHTLYQGEADAALMNTVCFDAFELGNHEFDESDTGLRRFLDHLRVGPCRTTVLAANVAPASGSPLAPSTGDDYLRPYLLKQVGGVAIGILGLETRDKTRNSSRPLPETRIDDEADTAQRYIDQLRAQGVRHIVLLTHQGYAADIAIAAKLSEVDVIVGGDSHTLLGDFSMIGIGGAGPYPTTVRNRDGDPVCIVQAWEYGKAFGLLNVRFDDQGRVVACRGEVTLPIGDDFRQQDASGAYVAVDSEKRKRIAENLEQRPNAHHVRVVPPDPQAQAELTRFSARLADMKKRRIGVASEPLCLVRVPGEATNRSAGLAGCETANTLARGSDIAQAVADAYRQASKQADIALQNAGGIRAAIPQGEVSFDTAYTVLPFSNVLYELRLSGQQIVEVLEEAVANHLDRGSSDGSHPYAAGLRWRLDMSQPRGHRFTRLEVRRKANDTWQTLRPEDIYTVVTSDFLAQGGDGYHTLARLHATGASVNTYLNYTQTFVDYLLASGTVTRPVASDYSHQGVIDRRGNKLP